MNMEIKARDLVAAGWHEGRRLGPALRRARELEAAGLTRHALLAQLEAEFPKQLAVLLPRHSPAPLAEAIAAETPEEAANVASARQRMTELLHLPVVQRGVLMPDACPSGGGAGTYPSASHQKATCRAGSAQSIVSCQPRAGRVTRPRAGC